MNEVYEKLIIGKDSSEVIDMIKFGDNLCGVAIKELFDRNKKLQEENEQLKKEYKIAIDELITDYKKLEKENEQLMIENAKLKNVITELKDINSNLSKIYYNDLKELNHE